MQAESRKRQVTVTMIILVATALLVLGAVWFNNEQQKKQNQAKQETNSQSLVSESSRNETSIQLKDGTYQATGHYISPGGEQALKVSITLKDGIIVDSSAQPDNKTPTSHEYQEKFIGGYKDIVIGKKPSEVRISHVSGSSLTSGGFKDALQQIEKQATS